MIACSETSLPLGYCMQRTFKASSGHLVDCWHGSVLPLPSVSFPAPDAQVRQAGFCRPDPIPDAKQVLLLCTAAAFSGAVSEAGGLFCFGEFFSIQ